MEQEQTFLNWLTSTERKELELLKVTEKVMGKNSQEFNQQLASWNTANMILNKLNQLKKEL